jgi:hypothetical protein
LCLDLHIPVYHNLNKIVIWCVFHIKKIQILKVAKRNKGDNLYIFQTRVIIISFSPVIIKKGDICSLYISVILNKGGNLYIVNKGDNCILFSSVILNKGDNDIYFYQ